MTALSLLLANFKNLKYIIPAIAILLCLGYVVYVIKKLDYVQEDNVAKQEIIKQQSEKISQIENDVKHIQEINKDLNILNRDFIESQKNTSSKLTILKNEESSENIKNIVNEDLKFRNRCIALATGVKAEKNEVNPNCQYLITNE